VKGWDEARESGTCAYDWTHTWKVGARIYVVHPEGTRARRYCAECAVRRQNAPPDTGEVKEVSDSPTYPTPLKALADRVGERFDAKAAAARNDE
jgi:hypothetical protein